LLRKKGDVAVKKARDYKAMIKMLDILSISGEFMPQMEVSKLTLSAFKFFGSCVAHYYAFTADTGNSSVDYFAHNVAPILISIY
jgi:hypothetical protein